MAGKSNTSKPVLQGQANDRPTVAELLTRPYVSIDELSEITGVSVSTLWRRYRDETIEGWQPGGPGTRVLFRPDAFERGVEKAAAKTTRPGVPPTSKERIPGRRTDWTN